MMHPIHAMVCASLLGPWVHAADPSPAKERLPAPEERFVLVFQDEFDGTRLDDRKWTSLDVVRHDGRWSPQAVELDGQGCLRLKTLLIDGSYLSGNIRSEGKFEQAFGYFTARIRLQRQPGHWSSFWLQSKQVGNIENDGRDGTEIDIMEKPWISDVVQQTLHWNGYKEHHQSAGKKVSANGIMDGFHTYSVWWKKDEYIFYIDGIETWRTNAGGVSQTPQFIILSDEVKFGSWAGDIRSCGNAVPDEFLVDYVRVYRYDERDNAP